MISADRILSALPIQIERRVPEDAYEGDQQEKLFVSFVHPLTEQAVSIQIDIWELPLVENDWGSGKDSRSSLVVAASLAEVGPESSDSQSVSTWTIFLLYKHDFSSEGYGYKQEDIQHELYSVSLNLSEDDTAETFSSPRSVVFQSRSEHAVSRYEEFLGVDLNGDSKIGSQFTQNQPDASDKSGVRFIRDDEGTAYIYKADGRHEYLQSDEWDHGNQGGGWQKKIIAIEKGDPFQFAAQKAFDDYLLGQGATTSSANDAQLAEAYRAGVDQAVKLFSALNRDGWSWGDVQVIDESNGQSQSQYKPLTNYFEAHFISLNAEVTNNSSPAFGKFSTYKRPDSVKKQANDELSFETSVGSWADFGESLWVVYEERSYYLDAEGQKTFNESDQRFIMERLPADSDYRDLYLYDLPVSWVEGFFGQDLNGDGSETGPNLSLVVSDDLLADEVDGEEPLRSDKVIAKDIDGKHYLLVPKADDLDVSKDQTFDLLRLDDWRVSEIWHDDDYTKSGKEPLTIFDSESEDNSDQSANTYLVVKRFNQEKLSGTEQIDEIEIFRLDLQTEDGNPVGVNLMSVRSFHLNDWNKADLLQYEEEYNRDFNGDDTVGKGEPVVVTWLDALTPGSTQNPDQVIATNAAGEVFILYKNDSDQLGTTPLTGYSVLPVKQDNSGTPVQWEQSSSWETRSPVGVVRAQLKEIKEAMEDDGWFPWGNSGTTDTGTLPTGTTGSSASTGTIDTGTTGSSASGVSALEMSDEAYFVAVKTQYQGQSPQWQIHIVDPSTGQTDWSSIWVSRISPFEKVFQQDLNFDGTVGLPVAVEVDGPDQKPPYQSTDAVRLLKDSEGLMFIKDYDDGANPDLMPILDEWGNTPRWEEEYYWDNWVQGGSYRVTVKKEAMGATKEVDAWGNLTYLVAVKETQTSQSELHTPVTRWQIHRLTPNDLDKRKVEGANGDNLYLAAATAFADALAAGLSNEEAFDEAAAAARDVALLEGMSEDAIDREIEVARQEFRSSLDAGRSAQEAFDLIFQEDEDSGSSTGADSYPQMPGSGSYAPYTPETPELPKNALLFNWWTKWEKSISVEEALFKQDLNNDGVIGVNVENFKLVGSDEQGLRLAKDPEGGVYIVEVDPAVVKAQGSKAIKSFKAITGNDSLEWSSSWGDGYNKREVFAVAAEREGLKIVGYKLLVRAEDKWSGQDKASVSWDIYSLDLDARISWGYWDEVSNTWKDDNVYGISSVKSYEPLFGQDLDGDGKIGLDIEDLTFAERDTAGARLARDSVGALYIVPEDAANTSPVSIGNASWLEYDNNWGWGSKESRVAIAAEEAVNAEGVKVGYWLALERKSQWGAYDSERTTYEILRVDLDGKVTWGYWDQESNRWVDESVYDAPSLVPYEDRFKQDFNGDGFIGIDPSSLNLDPRDTTGVRLARDAENSLYVLGLEDDGITPAAAKAVKGANWLEYDSGWGSKREAVAVEEADGGGYWIALKNTSTFYDWQTQDNKTEVTWDIYKLDLEARITWGTYVDNQWVDDSIYGAKSVAAYENLFNQDLNEDGRIGIDIDSLSIASTDTEGVRLARDSDGGVFLITDFGDAAKQKATPVGDSWLEYDYSSTDWVSKREVVAVESKGDGFLLAMRNTNTQWDGTQYEIKTSWDVIKLTASGKSMQGYWDPDTQIWVEPSEWGASIAAYEQDFNQDLNNDGSIGIDRTKLERVVTDTSTESGVRLYRDKSDSVLYLTNANLTIPIRNSSWMEYDNMWGDWGSSRTAIAAESLGTDAEGQALYKVVFRNENTWQGGRDRNWEVITIDSDGRQVWSEGSSIWTNRARIVESIVKEDLNNDGFIGPNPSDLTRIVSDDVSPFLEIDGRDDTLYIRDGSSLLPLLDKYGSPADLNKDVIWGRTTVSYKPWAVTKILSSSGDLQGYKVLVKVEKSDSSVASWELYNVSSEGIVDIFNIKTSKSVDRYELEFNQELDGVEGIGPVNVNPVTEVLDTGDVVLGRHRVNGELVGLYVVESGKNILLTTKTGALPNIEAAATGQTVKAVASHKLNLDDNKVAYKVAVKKEIVDGEATKVSWEVFHFDLASDGYEAVLDRSKTLFFADSAVRSVEVLVNQNLEADNNDIGFVDRVDPRPVQVDVGSRQSEDVGLVKAGIDASTQWLYIITESEDEDINDTYLEVKYANGANASLNSTVSYTENIDGDTRTTTINDEVFAATAVTELVEDVEIVSYRILVRQTTTVESTSEESATGSNITQSLSWKLFTVSADGVLDLNFIEAANPNRWVNMFSEDSQPQSFGVPATALRDFRTIKELKVSDGDLYIKDPEVADSFVPILLPDQSSVNFEFSESIGQGALSSEVKYLLKQEGSKDIYFMAVQRTYTEAAGFSTGFSVYTLDIKPDDVESTDRYAEVQLDKTYVTDDLSTFKDAGNPIFAGLESVA